MRSPFLSLVTVLLVQPSLLSALPLPSKQPEHASILYGGAHPDSQMAQDLRSLSRDQPGYQLLIYTHDSFRPGQPYSGDNTGEPRSTLMRVFPDKSGKYHLEDEGACSIGEPCTTRRKWLVAAWKRQKRFARLPAILDTIAKGSGSSYYTAENELPADRRLHEKLYEQDGSASPLNADGVGPSLMDTLLGMMYKEDGPWATMYLVLGFALILVVDILLVEIVYGIHKQVRLWRNSKIHQKVEKREP